MTLKGMNDPVDCPLESHDNDATGCVFVGLADILELEMAADIRSLRGAEAGVFDPALVKLLAKSYSLGESDESHASSSVTGSAACLRDVAKACRRNLEVASAAGLKCRSAVWSTVLTLLPLPLPLPVSVPSSQSQPASSSVTEITSSSSSSSSSSSCNDSFNMDALQVPFTSELLGALLLELLEGGDCQHFTVLSEILRRAGLLDAATTSAGISKVRYNMV
jgi:hypothetical protein